jgi:gamma-glutamylputrescine oxidase
MAPYPALNGDLVADVCVIGGGFTGVNTAIELAQRGLSVVLLEARRIGWGASGRNGGQLIRGIGHDVSGFAVTSVPKACVIWNDAGIESVNWWVGASANTASTATCAGASASWPTPRRNSPD